MAAITPREGRHLDTAAFYQHVVKFLPNYARPRFVRVQVSGAAPPLGPATWLSCPPVHAVTVVAELPGRHGHVQVPEDGAGEGGLRPRPGGASALLPGRTAEGLRAANAGNLRFRRVGEGQNLAETFQP